ncbi:unnamed protein product [Adineta steineri]|uniref:Uncharacterized protein n=1 Tax=Adineta steineri TaxID=433720 RepID=A0A819AN41_9BILA|nr:unnamed protein product [Adineta steineri]CAF3784634.1 unnamed protein product [Adineta steineri]
MQQIHTNRDLMPEAAIREGDNSSKIVRTDLSTILSDYTNSQRRYNDRLESLEREMVSLKGQFNEHELNQTFTTKKTSNPPPTSARGSSSSRIPLPVTPRRLSDDKPVTPANNTSNTHALPSKPVGRSRSFHNNTSDESKFLRSYKIQLEQAHQNNPSGSPDIRIPNYSSVEEVIRANEQLLMENDRLRSDFNRLKTENILLLRSMKATSTGNEPNLGNERIVAERERQSLTVELARQAEENKRLRKSLLAQSAKFIALRQSIHSTSLSTPNEHHFTSQSTIPSLPNSSRVSKSKSARYSSNNRGSDRTNTFSHASSDLF